MKSPNTVLYPINRLEAPYAYDINNTIYRFLGVILFHDVIPIFMWQQKKPSDDMYLFLGFSSDGLTAVQGKTTRSVNKQLSVSYEEIDRRLRHYRQWWRKGENVLPVWTSLRSCMSAEDQETIDALLAIQQL